MPKGRPKKSQISDARTLATGGTMVSVAQRPPSASTGISAKVAEAHIGLTNARMEGKEQLEPRAKRPRYTRGLLWDDEDDVLSATAQYSLTATPVPQVPIEESSNRALMETIRTNPHLFKIDCKINVDRYCLECIPLQSMPWTSLVLIPFS